jgi:hypothetical protein
MVVMMVVVVMVVVVMMVVMMMMMVMMVFVVVMMMMIVSELHVRLGTGLVMGLVHEAQKDSSIRDWIEQFAK